MTNALAGALSPYLRAHAGDPVAWFPWGTAAFEEAARRDVPVLVSIGYATCHWCHVMARESFRDPETAAVLNRDFIAVKVDREEHPEVDAAFMAAASAFTKQLGWPLNVFTTPDGAVFHAGTYWPAQPVAGVPAFRQVLAAASDAWRHHRAHVQQTGTALREALAELAELGRQAVPGTLTSAQLDDAAMRLAAEEDPQFGGFGRSGPKFPIPTALRFLQDRQTPAPARAVVARALAAMRGSALFDPVDGGFFRYATERDWSAPHFERMLTDNAQLLDVATAQGDRETAAAIVRFLLGVLQQAAGGFAAAQDAESIVDGVPSAGGYFARSAQQRASLSPPSVDGKIVTGWNGLAIGALARASVAFGWDDALTAAEQAALAVIENNHLATDAAGGAAWSRASVDEIASRAAATRADLGELADGLFALAAATGDVAWATQALAVLDATTGVASDPVLRTLGLHAPAGSDGDEPSDAAAVARAAWTAWAWGAGEQYLALARAQGTELEQALGQPRAFGATLAAARLLSRPPAQIVVVGADRGSALALAAAALPADVFVSVTAAQARAFAAAGLSLFDGKAAAVPTVFACDGFVCALPVTDPAALP